MQSDEMQADDIQPDVMPMTNYVQWARLGTQYDDEHTDSMQFMKRLCLTDSYEVQTVRFSIHVADGLCVTHNENESKD